MPRNGTGTYILPAGNPVVDGQLITANWANTTLNDLSTALTQSISRDGQTVPTGNQTMGGYKHTSVAKAVADSDYARYDQVLRLDSTGTRMVGDFSNATDSSRLSFQSSVVNGATTVNFIPNGTSKSGGIALFNSSDANNSQYLGVSSLSSECKISSGYVGTPASGTYLPMTFYTGGSERLRIDSSGNVGVGVSSTSGYRFAIGGAGVKTKWVTSDATSTQDYTDGIAYYGTTLATSLNLVTNNSVRLSIDATGTLTHTGDVILSGAGKRIGGDFTNATVGNRLTFQTNVLDGATSVQAMPNNAGSFSSFLTLGGSDANNSSYLAFSASNVGITNVIESGKTGSGAYKPLAFYVGGVERLKIDTAGSITATTSTGIGYGVGAGGTVTQATSKSTAVTLNKPCGRITTHTEVLAAGAKVLFAFNNSLVTATDTVVLTLTNNFGVSYRAEAYIASNGLVGIWLTNSNTIALGEAVPINFAIIKGATS